MTKKDLAKSVDALGALRDEIHGLKAKEELQTAALKVILRKQKAKAGKRIAQGVTYEAELAKGGKGVEITDLPRFKKAAGRKFLACIAVNLAKARKALGADRVNALGESKKLPDKLKIYKREPGKAPRRATGRKKK